jgi:hypothetical protein
VGKAGEEMEDRDEEGSGRREGLARGVVTALKRKTKRVLDKSRDAVNLRS